MLPEEPGFQSPEPDVVVTSAMLGAAGHIIDIAGYNLHDPAGRPVTYMTEGVAKRLAGTFPGVLLASLADTADEGEPQGWLWETRRPNPYPGILLQSDGLTSTFLLPGEY